MTDDIYKDALESMARTGSIDPAFLEVHGAPKSLVDEIRPYAARWQADSKIAALLDVLAKKAVARSVLFLVTALKDTSGGGLQWHVWWRGHRTSFNTSLAEALESTLRYIEREGASSP